MLMMPRRDKYERPPPSFQELDLISMDLVNVLAYTMLPLELRPDIIYLRIPSLTFTKMMMILVSAAVTYVSGFCLIAECALADFVSSTGSEKIPYVFMPLKHQLVHPTAEVALLGEKNDLSSNNLPSLLGIKSGNSRLELHNLVLCTTEVVKREGPGTYTDVTQTEGRHGHHIQLFRDSGRTYVQWVGEESARTAAEGRLVMVSLICRDSAQPDTPVFTPCLAFRVAGSPGASEAALSAPVKGGGGRSGSGLSSSEGVIIGLVVTCLAITYVIAMTIYIKVRRRRRRIHNKSKLAEEGVHGSSKSRGGGSAGGGERRPPRALPKPSLVSSKDDTEHEDIVDLSKASKTRRANRERPGITFTTAVVHGEARGRGGASHDSSDGIERAPRSSLAVVETLGGTEEEGGSRHVNINNPEGNGTPADIQAAQAKKKLYFNPAYFEPDMLQSPPPAALEFLERIREMITLAKSKMKIKTYQPSLVDIPEEDYEHPSRPMSQATGRCSQITVLIEDLEGNDEDAKCHSDHNSIQSDSLERPRDDDSRSSTLKRLARRVNSHGQSIVSEIIRTLDLKPRLPPVEGMYGFHSPKQLPPKPPPPKPVNARTESPVETDDEFPELIKPSMLRSVLRDGKRLTDLNNTFENFRQEMMATFNKMKKVGEAISPKSSLTRSRNKNKYTASPDSTADKKSVPGNSEGKVQKWLQTLEGKNSYSRMSEKQNVIFDSRNKVAPNDDPPPLPEKNSKPPTLPRKNKSVVIRNNSFSKMNTTTDNTNISTKDQQVSERGAVTRSLSWQNEHRHYDSNPRRPRQQAPILPEDSLGMSYGCEDDSLNDLLSEAESKVPKMTPSDSDSTYSDTRSGYRDTLENGKKKSEQNTTSLSRQLPREEEITERNEIFNKETGAKTMSRLARNGNNLYERIKSGNKLPDSDEDHMYEEIRFPGDGKQRPKKKSHKLQPKNSMREAQIDKYGDDEGSYSIYSNPESHISEVTIEEKCSSPVYSGCKVTIPVVDNMDGESEIPSAGFDQDTLEKRGKKVQRNGSIIQDSLERPKIRKTNNPDDVNANSPQCKKAQRRMSLPGEASKNKEKSLLDIYESRSSNRSLRNYRKVSPERSYSPMKYSPSATNNKIGSFYLNNISSANENNNIVNNTDQKKLRTFKDYQEMKFQRSSSDSDISSSPLPVIGSGINLNFRSSSPNNKEQKEYRPPLPPKHLRNSDINDNISPELPPRAHIMRPPLPQKSNRKYEIEVDAERPKLPEKARKRLQSDALSRSSSGNSIPELTEEEARSILHGLLAHTMHDASRLSPLHEEDDDTRHFLGVGNTAAGYRSKGSVPNIDSYSSGSLDSSGSSSSSLSCEHDGNALGKEVESSLERQIVNTHDVLDHPGSPGSEARVSGEFILSSIGRSPSLRRQTSLSKEQKYSFLAKLRDITGDYPEGDSLTKGMEIALALKAKTELEKHFKEKSGADSIKRTWRRIIENVDDAKEDKDKISILQLQQYMANLERKEKETKLKQEDSGYQSTDSSESANSKARSASSGTSSSNSLISNPHLLSSRSFSSSSLNSKMDPVFKRSLSLQQLNSSVYPEPPLQESSHLYRTSFLSTVGNCYSGVDGKIGRSGSSIYINNSFSNDERNRGDLQLS
ncbi:hypothetical protein SK128_011134 [Halocaridina rubra]|uniref:Uncharacterized protein n=1 Tax=Halocaridina rubra TaxID=373956 RepID=A0AAN8XAQ7_HALRR